MFALISCGASKKKISEKKPSPIEIESTTELENFLPFLFDNIIISSKVNLQINQQYLTFDLTSRIDSGSKILLSGNVILPVFKILIESDKVLGYDRINREYFQSSIDELNSKFNLNLGLEEVQRILIGNPLFSVDKLNDSKKSIIDEGVLFENYSNDFNFRFVFDSQMKNLTQQSIVHNKSGASIQLLYSGKLIDKTKDIPSQIRARIIYDNNVINLNIKNRSRLLDRGLTFPYRVPKGYSRIKIWKSFLLKYR